MCLWVCNHALTLMWRGLATTTPNPFAAAASEHPEGERRHALRRQAADGTTSKTRAAEVIKDVYAVEISTQGVGDFREKKTSLLSEKIIPWTASSWTFGFSSCACDRGCDHDLSSFGAHDGFARLLPRRGFIRWALFTTLTTLRPCRW